MLWEGFQSQHDLHNGFAPVLVFFREIRTVRLPVPTIRAQDVKSTALFDLSLAVFPVPDHVKLYRQCGFCRASTPLRAVPWFLAKLSAFLVGRSKLRNLL
jgi:hypothetical protein